MFQLSGAEFLLAMFANLFLIFCMFLRLEHRITILEESCRALKVRADSKERRKTDYGKSYRSVHVG